jgi:hypothetical protein
LASPFPEDANFQLLIQQKVAVLTGALNTLLALLTSPRPSWGMVTGKHR